MLYTDVKFANILGPRLRNFKRKNEYLWNYSCPVCGDSQTNKAKARGYIYRVKTGLFVKCHKCGYSTNLGNLIKYVDPALYQEYVFENYKEGGAPHTPHKSAEVALPTILHTPELQDDVLSSIKRLDQLRIDHPAVKYCLKRKITPKMFPLLYYAPRFKKFVNSVIPNKFKDPETDEHPRLIIPYLNTHGKCFAFQGRAFKNEEPKYITIKIDEDGERIFGLDRINYAKRVYIVEGPIDSLFIPNCLAVSGSSFNSQVVEALKTNSTIVYDNEPRSKELTKLIKKTIDRGFSVCLWPDTFEFKDINDAVVGGMSPEQIVDVINANTYNGAEAILKFATWKRC